MTLRDFFEQEKIFEYSLLPFEEVSITDAKKAERMFKDGGCKTVVPFLIPYLVREEGESNISVYAHSRDYHFYFKELSERAREHFPVFSVGCDTSPINEVACAVSAGLGSVGKNGLLINGVYGTYAFVAEFFFALPDNDPIFDGIKRRDKGQMCHECGACEKSCPTNALESKTGCISYINQKKRLDEGDAELIAASGSVWGCDICQSVCPYNKNAKETEIDFFKEKRTPYLTEELIDRMTADNTFSERAYAWRGEEVVRRNIRLCQTLKNVKP